MKRFHWYDYITINIYWFGLTAVSQSNGLIQPLLIQRFATPEQQGTFYGNMRLYSLMVALLVQALAGMLSDRSLSKYGKRRPYILIGTLLNVVALFAIGASPTYWFLFLWVVFSQVASNIAHGATQGFIPDLVPEDRRGRFSGIKAVMELLPVIVIGFTIGKLLAEEKLWPAITIQVGLLLFATLIALLVKEKPRTDLPEPLDWKPFGRLVAMTLVFMVSILLSGEVVQAIGRTISSDRPVSVHLVTMGLVGLAGMLVAVVLGVWGSVQISIGSEASRKNPSFTWWVINRLAFLVGANNLSTFAIYFIQGRLGYESFEAAGPAANLKIFVGVLILVFAFPSGYLADRIGRKMLLGLSGVLAAVGTVILLLSPNLTVIMIGGGVVGAAIGMFFTTNWALGTDIVPKESAGKFLGISNLAGAGAGAVGAYIGGPIADYFTGNFPQSPGLGYMLIFAIYGALFLVSAIVLLKVQEQMQFNSKMGSQ
jgi:MFS family permease